MRWDPGADVVERGKRRLALIEDALKVGGVLFIDQNGNGPGVQLRDRIVPPENHPRRPPALSSSREQGTHRKACKGCE